YEGNVIFAVHIGYRGSRILRTGREGDLRGASAAQTRVVFHTFPGIYGLLC
ncbi:hypothetical protein F2P79_024841, partial [Pimephales promelas]